MTPSSRRHFLQRTAAGIGMAAVSRLLGAPHFNGNAKSVIFLYMPGGPSQIDLFDPKPELAKWHGKALPQSLTKDLKLAFIKPTAAVAASPRVFARHGESGTQISDWMPNLAKRADDLCLLRAVHTEAFNHDPGEMFLMSGHSQFGRPSMGSWVVYGLGSDSKDLPGFVVLSSGTPPSAGANNWSAGFLPSSFQGTPFRGTGEPIPFLASPAGYDTAMQRARLDAIGGLNRRRFAETLDPEIESRIASYELAFRMQSAAPELLDFSKEAQATLDMYGVNEEPTRPYAVNCLLARRMVERGVRFVLVSHGSWDDHNDLDKNLKKNCDITDKPAAALLADLKQRGLLDSTLVIWGGEFGRTPMTQQQRTDIGYGRDHHPNCFSMWLAGGGVRAGQVVGRTDDFGLQGVEDPVSVNDLQATILHLLGFDHTRLTYNHMGRNFRLTDVHGSVVKKVLRA
jgi:uncharacterized protein (DUF1501 family)